MITFVMLDAGTVVVAWLLLHHTTNKSYLHADEDWCSLELGEKHEFDSEDFGASVALHHSLATRPCFHSPTHKHQQIHYGISARWTDCPTAPEA
jgi:hypothetical protein